MVDENHDNADRTDGQVARLPNQKSAGTIESDTVHELCRSRYCRCVLAVLDEERRSLTVNDLTHTILKYNHHTPITEASAERLRQIRRSLYDEHIPKLVSEGVVEFDEGRYHVEPTEKFDQLQPYLSAITDIDPDFDGPAEL